jgi:DNA-binding NtrC family response regulator
MTTTAACCEYILIVDDDYDTREMLVTLLRQNGYCALTAVDREEAAAILAKTPVRTILLDYMMPGPSAPQFLDVVAWNYPHTQIILMTAGDRVDTIAVALGLTRYIGKPFDEGTLFRMLADHEPSVPTRKRRKTSSRTPKVGGTSTSLRAIIDPSDD